MADQATAEATQADADDESQVDTDKPNPQAGAGSAEKTYSQTAYKKVQSEAINLRERLRKYEEAEKAGMTDAERLKKEREELDRDKAQFAQERRAGTVEGVARAMGAVYPDTIISLISPDAETEREIKAALTRLQAERPRLFQTGSADGGAGAGEGGRANADDMNGLIRRQMRGARLTG